MDKLYYLVRLKEDGSIKDYVSHFNASNETFSTMTGPRNMMLMTEREVCKYYGMQLLNNYTICEVDLGNRVQLFVEFKPIEEPQPIQETEKVIVKE